MSGSCRWGGWVLLICLSGSWGCRAAAPPAEEPARSAPAAAPVESAPWLHARVHLCGDDFGFAVAAAGDSAWLLLPGEERHLARSVSASGARYSDGEVELWSQGGETRLEMEGLTRTCWERPVEGVWARARSEGVAFRAIGQEPGWLLEIVPDRWMHVSPDYGQTHVYTPVPVAAIDPTSRLARYEAVTESHDLEVELHARLCQDIMSGEIFPLTVTVRLDGAVLAGCGSGLRSETPAHAGP